MEMHSKNKQCRTHNNIDIHVCNTLIGTSTIIIIFILSLHKGDKQAWQILTHVFREVEKQGRRGENSGVEAGHDILLRHEPVQHIIPVCQLTLWGWGQH